MRHRTWTGAASAALALVAAVGLAGCGDESDAGSTTGTRPGGTNANSASDHNDADVAFASHMILHHQQALQMSGMAKWQATTAGVKKLAATIAATQESEMKLMSGWLAGWGEPVPARSHSGHELEDEIAGMMTEDELHELGRAQGSTFDQVWIRMMIRHHQGAVTMAKTEQTSGKSAATIALAQKIVTDQTAQLTVLKRLLSQLPPVR